MLFWRPRTNLPINFWGIPVLSGQILGVSLATIVLVVTPVQFLDVAKVGVAGIPGKLHAANRGRIPKKSSE